MPSIRLFTESAPEDTICELAEDRRGTVRDVWRRWRRLSEDYGSQNEKSRRFPVATVFCRSFAKRVTGAKSKSCFLFLAAPQTSFVLGVTNGLFLGDFHGENDVRGRSENLDVFYSFHSVSYGDKFLLFTRRSRLDDDVLDAGPSTRRTHTRRWRARCYCVRFRNLPVRKEIKRNGDNIRHSCFSTGGVPANGNRSWLLDRLESTRHGRPCVTV